MNYICVYFIPSKISSLSNQAAQILNSTPQEMGTVYARAWYLLFVPCHGTQCERLNRSLFRYNEGAFENLRAMIASLSTRNTAEQSLITSSLSSPPVSDHLHTLNHWPPLKSANSCLNGGEHFYVHVGKQ